MNVLVTGSNGFFGSHIARELTRRSHYVYASHRRGSDLWRLKDIEDKITLIEMDITNKESIHSALEKIKIDAIINSAAYGVKYEEQDMEKAFAINVLGTAELIEAAENLSLSRFIHIGSCFEYGNKDHPIEENEVLEPTAVYGVTKASATLLALQMAGQKGIPLTVVRPFALWGTMEDSHRLAPLIISHCLNKKPLNLTGGEQIRDYLFIEDAANMMVDLLEAKDFHSLEILNLGSGKPLTLKDFIYNIAAKLKGEELMRFGELPYRPTEMWKLVANTEKWTFKVGAIKKRDFSENITKMIDSITKS